VIVSTAFREARAEDVAALAELFRQSVEQLGPTRYSPEQVRMWASFADEPAFRDFIMTPATLIAESPQGVLGFCGVVLPRAANAGHIASLYVAGRVGRLGLGSRLLAAAMERGHTAGCEAFHAEASEFSLPVFLRQGFILSHVEEVERKGVPFRRYVVRKSPA
jgi:putative acetyltransferase